MLRNSVLPLLAISANFVFSDESLPIDYNLKGETIASTRCRSPLPERHLLLY